MTVEKSVLEDAAQNGDSRANGSVLRLLGPGLITGASDDDPSGIATYSQAGAQFGFDLGWVMLVSWPLMCAIQEISARIGRVTGRGIAGNLKRNYPLAVVYGLILLLIAANTINLGADLGAMGAALKLVLGNGQSEKGGPALIYVAGFAFVSILLEVFVRYDRYVAILKWLSLSLLAYVAVALVVDTPWRAVALSLILPHLSLDPSYITVVVAILGTTISPYLFFWQAEEEVEDVEEKSFAKPLTVAPQQAGTEFKRIRVDTYLGMGISNAVALFIMITTAVTLHAHNVTDIQTSAQAALALRPIAGDFAFLIFALGIIGCGLLAIPVLAASAAYALGELLDWNVGLGHRPNRAKSFYGAIAIAVLVGAVLNIVHIDPIKALFWSAVINGVAAVPIMAMILHLASRSSAMGSFKIPLGLKILGWIATGVMGAAACAMAATMRF